MIKVRNERKEELKKELTELERYALFLGTLAPLVESVKETPDIDFIGLTIREPDMVVRLKEALSRITNWKYELVTEPAEDGSLVGLITVERDLADRVKKTLSDEQVPELTFPAVLQQPHLFGKGRLREEEDRGSFGGSAGNRC